jgi:formylglycine-generating enzyme required for sulfatase activity
VIDAFRAEGVGFLMPPAREGIEDSKVIDISHESLIRQWQYFQRWLREVETDVAELHEWQHRAAQNRDHGGGWLDENDAARAGQWRARIEERGNPKAWLKRYFPSNPGGAEAVFGYIDESARRVCEDRENRERLEREAQEAEIKRLEAEARLQQEMAANSERERARAEQDKQRAEASARTSRRVTRVAIASTFVVGLVAAFVTWLWWGELTIEHGRAKVLTWLHRYHIEPEMVEIPAGSFQRGDLQGTSEADEKPVRKVEFQKPFAIGKYEVTIPEYERYLYAQGFKEHNFPSDQGWGRERRPVINVSWDDVVAYARWLSKQTGKHYRLPTEAEWEYAARGGTTSTWFWSDDASKACTYANVFDRGHEAELRSRYPIPWGSVACEDGYAETAPVGSFKANSFGVHDAAGNVWEWVEDCYHGSYEGAPLDGSAWNDDGCNLRVLRGGSWGGDPGDLRASNRDRRWPGYRRDYVGFRLAQDP